MHHSARFRQNGRLVTEIWRFNGFQNGGRPTFEVQFFLTVGAVNRSPYQIS